MAIVYLRSTNGNDADDGSTWALAKATLQAAMTAAGAGGTVYLSQAHAESVGAALTITSPGTAAAPTLVLCVNDSAEPPTALATTGSVGNTTNQAVTIRGIAYFYGVKWNQSQGFGATAVDMAIGDGNIPTALKFEDCTFTLHSTSTGQAITLGASSVGTSSDDLLIEFVDCAFVASAAALGLFTPAPVGRVIFTGGTIAASGTVPASLLLEASAFGCGTYVFRGVDLSALGSGKTLFTFASPSRFVGDVLFHRCKLGSSVAVTSGASSGPGGATVRVVNCDSSDTNYRFSQAVYAGTESFETTIVRSGGATDGTTPIARKVVTTVGATAQWPYEALPIEFWNESLSALTVTIPVLTDNVTLTDAEAWLEVDYLGTSGFPLGVFASDRVADPIFGTPANQTTDSSSSWTTTGLGTPVKQSLSVTFTPAEKGIVRARVCIAKASTTVYYDPKALTTSARQYQSTAGYVNEGAAAGFTPLSRFGYTGIAEH